MAQTPAVFLQTGDSLDHTPVGAVTAGDVVLLGTNLVTIAKSDIAAGDLGAVSITGVFDVPKDNSDITGVCAAYWDADGDPVGGTSGSGAFTKNAALGPFAGWFLEVAGTSVGTVQLALNSRDSAVSPTRASLTQDDLAPFAIPVTELRVWDAPQTVLPGTPANDDLGLIYNTLGTASPSVESGDAKAATVTRYAYFQFPVPKEYVAGETITLRVNAGMKTTVSDTTAVLDAEVYRQAAPTVDICATAQQSINSLTAADKDFTITPTSVVPGDLLEVRLKVAIVDAATGTAVIGKIYRTTMLMDIKG